MYEYMAVEVPFKKGLNVKTGITFESCMDTINDYAKKGWRLVQIVTVQNEKAKVFMPFAYKIIFEKEKDV